MRHHSKSKLTIFGQPWNSKAKAHQLGFFNPKFKVPGPFVKKKAPKRLRA